MTLASPTTRSCSGSPRFSGGPYRELGRQMRLGIQAAFYEVNQAGGVHGRQLKLETIDDSYEPDSNGVSHHQVAHRPSAGLRPHRRGGHAHVPRRGPAWPTTPAFLSWLRSRERSSCATRSLGNVLNLRASYHQETEEMVARLTEDLGATRVAVLYQDDAYRPERPRGRASGPGTPRTGAGRVVARHERRSGGARHADARHRGHQPRSGHRDWRS